VVVLHAEKFAEERLLFPGEQRHIHLALGAAQDRAQSGYQQAVEIVQRGIAAPGVFQVFEAGSKPIQRGLRGAFEAQRGRINQLRAGQAISSQSSESEIRLAWAYPHIQLTIY
jgi:hypothetical protein